MIISGKQIQSIVKAYGEQTKVSKSAQPPASPAQKKDEVILSSQAQEFSQVLQTVRNLPAVREDKVKELAEKVASGTYKVDSKDIADQMIGRMLADRLR